MKIWFRCLAIAMISFATSIPTVPTNGEEVIWRLNPTPASQGQVPNSAVTGLGPDFLAADFALSQVFVECIPGQPRIGLPGTINVARTFFANDAQVDFQNLPDSFFNAETGNFEIDGQAILNLFVVDDMDQLPRFVDNPNLGQMVPVVFSQDLNRDLIEVRAENLGTLQFVIDENVRYYVGLTPVFVSFDLRPFDGIALTNDFPFGNESQSAVRQTAPDLDEWRFAGDVFGPPQQLFATIQLNGEPLFKLGDSNQDGIVNLLDVSSFVDQLSFGKFLKQSDINGDGFVNLLDVQGFVEILASGGT